jgi:phage terminase large subunit GpA-like protein
MIKLDEKLNDNAIEIYCHIFEKLDDEKLTLQVSEWAELRRVLPEGLTSQPGPWSNDVAPFMVEPMDCLSDSSEIQVIVMMKGAQITATTSLIENLIGYVIDESPGPMMYITGDKGMAEQSIELKVDRMLESTGLVDKISSQSEDKKRTKTGNTKTKKEFAGGFLIAQGPRSGSKLRGFSIKYLMLDEVDAYPQQVGDEGDPIKLALRRTDAYELTRKVLLISTPLVKDTSRILPEFLKGDQRYYYVPCKKCKKMQRIKWDNIKYETDDDENLIYDSVHYQCDNPKCKAKWKNSDKVTFLGKGEWRATATPKDPFTRSYQISSLYSPVGMRSWENIVQEWLEVKDNPAMLKVFVNTVLGECWEERGENTKYEIVYARRETYHTGEIPEECYFITFGADVQKDRIELQLVAWGRNKESWAIDYKTFYGDTSDINSDAWVGLDDFIKTTYFHPLYGEIGILIGCIDSNYNSPVVYSFCEQYENLYPVRGDSHAKKDKFYQPRAVAGYGTTRYDLCVDLFKDEFYGYLKKREKREDGSYPTGFCHFPIDFDEEFFKGLTAEIKIKKISRAGNVSYAYKKIRERNEQLDTRVYALAAVYIYAAFVMDHLKIKKLDWKQFWHYIMKITRIEANG